MVFAAALAAPLTPLIPSHKVWASSGTIRKNSKTQKQKQRQKLEQSAIGNVTEVVKKDAEFIKRGIGKGMQWANKAFGIPKLTKSLDNFIWLRHVEDPRASVTVSDAPTCPQPHYPGAPFSFLFCWFTWNLILTGIITCCTLLCNAEYVIDVLPVFLCSNKVLYFPLFFSFYFFFF